MGKSTVIHAYNEQKVELFWWIVYLVGITVGFIVGLFLIVSPISLFILFGSPWLLILFAFIPLGVWIDIKLVKYTKKMLWENNHLSSYILVENKIETREWDKVYRHTPSERDIPLEKVIKIIASSYIVRQTIRPGPHYKKTTETAPILYIVYLELGEHKLLTIPFPSHTDQGWDNWLEFLNNHFALHFTASVLYRKDMPFLDDFKRLDYLLHSTELVPFLYTGDWLKDEPLLFSSWKGNLEHQQKKN